MKNLTFWVLLGAIAGFALGQLMEAEPILAQGEQHWLYGLVLLLKSIFIGALRMLVAPVVFFSLISGLIGIRDRSAMRRLGGATVAYYFVTTAIAVMIGLAAVHLVHPWTAHPPLTVDADTAEVAASMGSNRSTGPKLIEQGSEAPGRILKSFALRSLQNPFAALADMNILAIVLHALLIGIAMVVALPPESKLIEVVHDLNRVFHRLLGWVIWMAPAGVFAVVFDFTLTAGGRIAGQLGGFCALVFAATLLHGLVILPLIGWWATGLAPHRFFRRAAKPLLVALSTASSAATLPVTMQTCEEEFGVSPAVTSFVCPLGATMSMDGTALFEGIAAVFLAYLYGIDLGVGGITAIFTMAMISSIGAPGMPSGSMAAMQMVLLAAGIPLEGILILLVVERPLDTFRTAVNVEGDMIGAAVVERFMRMTRA